MIRQMARVEDVEVDHAEATVELEGLTEFGWILGRREDPVQRETVQWDTHFRDNRTHLVYLVPDPPPVQRFPPGLPATTVQQILDFFANHQQQG